ncbi:unnamed protein product [Oppiella nova]|uniref:SOSS complex subunit C homolog n=1 Tax=Oppiella nova TaxID=334625 RepID=A0A7R9QKC0_9ACAR|nr:unnamed protein product [Oppiella nova]CAG2166727.1 unnamed protein product [Oppiella nova]
MKMSFQMPNQRQEQQRNKILEDLQKKQQLLKQQSISGQSSSAPQMTPNTTSLTPTTGATTATDTASTSSTSSGSMTSTQRAALNHANNNSFGFFIPQDSSFGNLILPVLPRF